MERRRLFDKRNTNFLEKFCELQQPTPLNQRPQPNLLAKVATIVSRCKAQGANGVGRQLETVNLLGLGNGPFPPETHVVDRSIPLRQTAGSIVPAAGQSAEFPARSPQPLRSDALASGLPDPVCPQFMNRARPHVRMPWHGG